MLELKITILKKLIAAMTMLISLLSVQLEEPKLGAVLSAEETKLNEIKTEQNDYFMLKNKYKQKNTWMQFGNSPILTYKMWEYLSPEGAGYQVFIRKENDVTLSERSIGYGPEKATRTWNWIEIIDKDNNFVSSTSTQP